MICRGGGHVWFVSGSIWAATPANLLQSAPHSRQSTTNRVAQPKSNTFFRKRKNKFGQGNRIISPASRNAQQLDASGSKSRFLDQIAFASRLAIMAGIVQLNHAIDRKVRLPTDDKIGMLSRNSIKGRIPIGPPMVRHQQISNAHLWKNGESHRTNQLEYTKKRALGRGEKSFRSVGIDAWRGSQEPSEKRQTSSIPAHVGKNAPGG